MTYPLNSMYIPAKCFRRVLFCLLVNQVHGAAFKAAAAVGGSSMVAHSGAKDRRKFGGLAEHALAHTWVSRKLEELELPDGGTAGVAECFLDTTSYQDKCESCCGACTKALEIMNNLDSEECVCSVLGDSSTTSFKGSAYNDCIFIPGYGNENINASTPASDAAKERLPFPRAERGSMPPGAPKSERVRDPAS